MANTIRSESGSQLLARLKPRPSLSDLDTVLFPNGLHGGDVVEISGSAGSGKSSLLLHLLSKCLLPKWYKNLEIGGLNAGAILIDTSHNISIVRLASQIEKCILDTLSNYKEKSEVGENGQGVKEWIDEIVKESLNRLIIFKTYSSMQLEMNFHSVTKIIQANSNISLLIIDDISYYYWSDTLNVINYKKMDLYLKVLIQNLMKCIKDFKISVIFVKPARFKSKKSNIIIRDVTYKVELKKKGRKKNLFLAVICFQHSKRLFSITENGFQWVTN